MRIAGIVSTLFLVLPLAILAIPTGLNMIPTAQILGIGGSRLDYETTGSGKLYVSPTSTITGSQVGLIMGFEAGADQLSDQGTVYNVKWQLFGGGLGFPAVAVGAQNISGDGDPQYYAVATQSLPLISLTAGLMRVDDEDLTVYGAAARLGPIMVKADRVEGDTVDRTAYSAGIAFGPLIVTGTEYDFESVPNERTLTLTYMQSF